MARAYDKGPQSLRVWSAEIAREINQNKPVPGTGTSATQSPSGTAISRNAAPTAAASKAAVSGGGGGGGGASLPPMPTEGTYVLGAIDGTLTWLETDTCG